jgi:hypothetical protein
VRQRTGAKIFNKSFSLSTKRLDTWIRQIFRVDRTIWGIFFVDNHSRKSSGFAQIQTHMISYNAHPAEEKHYLSSLFGKQQRLSFTIQTPHCYLNFVRKPPRKLWRR